MNKPASTVVTHLTRRAFFLVLLFLASQVNPSAYSQVYYFTTGTGTIVPGTTDTGNHADDGTTFISLPFSYQLYDQRFTGVNVSSNGNLQFVSNSNMFTNACPLAQSTLNYAIMPHWDDLVTGGSAGCTGYTSGCGIFTSTSGTAPNRIFNIEWRTVYLGANTRANFEVRLYEGQNQFALVYGEVAQGGSSATVGVQRDPGPGYTQFECNTAGSLTSGLRLVFTERCLYLPVPDTDFNNDLFPDYVLYNGATRRTAIWFLHNNSLIGSAFGPTPPPGWNVIDVADFDRDDNVDYALFNATTRQTAIWYLVGTSFSSSALGPTLPMGWALVAVSDFNGDCKPEYLLYNSSARRTAVWYLNNNVFTGSASGPTLPAGWRVAGVADFDGDGNRDYALFNVSTRQTAIWYLMGTTFMTGAFGPTPPAGWQLIGVADFDRDGPDYLLFNATTRKTAIWYLHNSVFVSGAFGPTTPAGWQVVAP